MTWDRRSKDTQNNQYTQSDWDNYSQQSPVPVRGKAKLNKYIITGICTIAIGIGVVLGTSYVRKESIGLEIVDLMYNFETPYELDENMIELKGITTDEIYKSLTIDNTDRTLNVYLKFKNNPVEVEIIKSTDSYVLYRLHTDSITGNRKFLMTFDTDLKGNINYIREMEVIDFTPNTD